ncbi:hypothetical protein GCM10007853_14610 [Algimonas ampicilliniresistens]|uniref:UbiA family prenyltransferase n=1 Tax=Algimonas ampicilliniresistens TaxID=1298735 RepID=A0ABQ5VB57_9PROT|nr:haloacid dehalogenase-like hydrolase [Algimonas ampicilliniresistens]GLQ23587.1 hypothetical protein GCM10007853_14610 [Algimonas ampicilliniresistens]
MTRPLILDVDGTLLKSDLTHEMILEAIKRDPLKTVHYARLGARSKPAMKQEMVARIGQVLDTDVVPLEPKIVALAEQAIADGRDVYLCSGTEESLVKRLAERLDFVTDAFGTSPTYNMTSENKASFLRERFPDGFDYAGNSTQDFAVWEVAQSGYAIRPPKRTAKTRTAAGEDVVILEDRTSTFGALLEGMRPSRWWYPLPVLVLVYVAVLRGMADNIWLPIWASLMWVLVVAALSLMDDLRDIHQDRRDGFLARPIAAGELSVPKAVIALVLLMIGAAFISLAVLPPWMFPVLLVVLYVGSAVTRLKFDLPRSLLTRLAIALATLPYIPLALGV